MQEKQARNLPDDTIHLEDLALKSAAQYFGEELLQYIGVKENLIPILLSPLMSGTMGIKERIVRELGASREVTLNKAETKFSLSKEAAESYLDRYWK